MLMEGQVKFFSLQKTAGVSQEKGVAVISKAIAANGDWMMESSASVVVAHYMMMMVLLLASTLVGFVILVVMPSSAGTTQYASDHHNMAHLFTCPRRQSVQKESE